MYKKMEVFMLSKEMANSIGFSFIVEKLKCFSYYGDENIRKINALLIDSVTLHSLSDSIKLVSCFQNILRFLELQPYQIVEIQNILSNIKNIGGIVKKLEYTYLSEVEIFEIKRFLLSLEKLIDLWNKTEVQLDGIKFTNMTDALNILDSQNQRIAAFSIHDDDFPALKAARQEKAQVEALIDKHGITEELVKKRAKIVAKEDKYEQAALRYLSSKLRPFVSSFMSNMENTGSFDFTLAKAILAKQTGATCPKISSKSIRLANMWNPKTNSELEKKGRAFTKTSINIEPGATVLIGANMGGKSVTIRTVLLNVLLANMGFFVFADKAEIPFLDDVFLIEEGVGDDFLSSFGAEVMQINDLVKSLEEKRLFVAMDEPARTTNPIEGTKIVRGIVKYLDMQESISLISTHYANVQECARAVYKTASFSYDGLSSANAESLHGFIKYEIKKVSPDEPIPAEAINLCKILGMNPTLLAEIIK